MSQSVASAMPSTSFIVLYVLAGFGSDCLMAPAAAGGSRLFQPGSILSYDYESTVLMNEAQPGQGKDVGFQIFGKLSVDTIWQSPSSPQSKVLQLKLINPKLLIKSRKAPAPEGFITHTSRLEEMQNSPFLLQWNNGIVKSVYINQNEDVSMINLKKGIASFFQFQTQSQELKEVDASGLCEALYTALDRNMIEKIKSNCQPGTELPVIRHPDQLFGATISSKSRSVIVLAEDLTGIDNIESKEEHTLVIPLREEVGGTVVSHQRLKLQDRSPGTNLIQENNIEAVVKKIEQSSGRSFAKHSLTLTKENEICVDGSCPTLYSAVKENRDALKEENLGSIRSASAFLKLLNIVRGASKEDLIKTLKSSKNKNILLQLLDLMGAAQTVDAHQAALKVLNFHSEDLLDLNERYLWSLSLGSHPVSEVIKDLINIIDSGPYNEKLDETLILTVAAMTNKLKKLSQPTSEGVEREVFQLLKEHLKKCSATNDACQLKYIRAFKNLAALDSIPILLEFTTSKSKRVSVAAINAVFSFPVSTWSSEVFEKAKNIFFQLDKRYDSSARTLALDIMLKNGLEDDLLADILLSLQKQDSAYEIRQYLLQRLRQTGESNITLTARVKTYMKTLNLHNYHILAQKGLSTAFTRSFMRHPSANGTLSTIQEISGGIVKRGLVDVIIDKSETSQSIFTLGLFAGGLSSFLSSDDNNQEEEEEEEVATAGMDLTVMGVQVRPFVFFTGQGELMGHVWSGTASERTPAFQALALLHDHLQYIPLQAGFMAKVNLQGGTSFDLSGQVSLSLWNRNAESLVEKSAGLSILGMVQINTMFVHSKVLFNLATEVKLSLVSNIDFSKDIALCLQLEQQDSVIKHNVHKVERIPGSKHRLRKSKYKVMPVSGKTYALNQKNNELCNVIFVGH